MFSMDYTVDSVSWHLKADPDPAFHQRIRERFRAVAHFLQTNNLTTGVILPMDAEVDDNFQLKSSSLTEEGLALMRNAYSKWQKAQNKGKAPSDVTILQKELEKLRKQ